MTLGGELTLKKLILFIFVLIFNFSFSEMYYKGKILEKIKNPTENTLLFNDEIENGNIKRIDFYKVQINKNIIQVEHPLYYDDTLNYNLKKNDKIILMKDKDENNNDIYFITDKDKSNTYFILIGIFAFLTILIAKGKGIKGLFSLFISVGSIFYFFLPLVIKGYSPIILSVITALFSAIITISFIAGFNKKGLVAILGSIGGVIVSGLLSLYFVNSMSLTGYTTVEAIGYAELLTGIKLKELISAGIILGSMGAIMDVSMSISSSIIEIKELNPKIKPLKVFTSGINIGQDIIGTMINTLILAYIGGSLFDILIIFMNIKELSYERLFNFEFIAVEILKSFTGSIGILIAIPITAYLGAYFYHK